jgi:hypothetical protein
LDSTVQDLVPRLKDVEGTNTVQSRKKQDAYMLSAKEKRPRLEFNKVEKGLSDDI